MSAAKTEKIRKGKPAGGVTTAVTVNVYMPGVNGVTDCHPSVLSKASVQTIDFKGGDCVDEGTFMHWTLERTQTGVHRRTQRMAMAVSRGESFI